MLGTLRSDDFQVTDVAVALTALRASGSAIDAECGASKTPAGSGRWTLREWRRRLCAGTTVRIEVTATDWPGHTGAERKRERDNCFDLQRYRIGAAVLSPA
jgi:hypothetical protein